MYRMTTNGQIEAWDLVKVAVETDWGVTSVAQVELPKQVTKEEV